MKPFESAHFSDGSHAGISDLTASQIEPDNAISDGLKHRELVIPEFLRSIDHVDAEAVIFGRDGHHRKMILGGGIVDFSHAGVLLFGGERVPD